MCLCISDIKHVKLQFIDTTLSHCYYMYMVSEKNAPTHSSNSFSDQEQTSTGISVCSVGADPLSGEFQTGCMRPEYCVFYGGCISAVTCDLWAHV